MKTKPLSPALIEATYLRRTLDCIELERQVDRLVGQEVEPPDTAERVAVYRIEHLLTVDREGGA